MLRGGYLLRTAILMTSPPGKSVFGRTAKNAPASVKIRFYAPRRRKASGFLLRESRMAHSRTRAVRLLCRSGGLALDRCQAAPAVAPVRPHRRIVETLRHPVAHLIPPQVVRHWGHQLVEHVGVDFVERIRVDGREIISVRKPGRAKREPPHFGQATRLRASLRMRTALRDIHSIL